MVVLHEAYIDSFYWKGIRLRYRGIRTSKRDRRCADSRDFMAVGRNGGWRAPILQGAVVVLAKLSYVQFRGAGKCRVCK